MFLSKFFVNLTAMCPRSIWSWRPSKHRDQQDKNLSAAESQPHWIKLYVEEPGVDALDLSNAKLRMEQVEGILESLINSQVTDLNLEGNNLNGGMERLAELLIKTKIKTLNIRDCRFSNTDMMHLMKVVNSSQITSLDISRNTCQPDMSFMEEFASCLVSSKITNLNVSGIVFNGNRPPVFRVLFSSLPGTAVKELHVARNYLSVAELQVLGQSLRDSKVEVLDLSLDYLGNDGFGAIIPGLVNSRVSKLHLSHDQISYFRNFGTQIKFLDLRHSNLLRETAAIIVAPKVAQTTFTHFDPSDCWIVRNAQNIVTNPKFTSITYLKLDYHWFDDADAIILAKHLKETQVNELDLSYNGITSEGAKALAAQLKDTKLLSIDLSHNKIESDGLEALAAGAQNTLITQLDVSCNPIQVDVKPSFIIRNVMWKNRASVQPFIHTFKLLAPTGTDNILQFDCNVDNTDIDGFLDKVLVLYETIVKKPHFVHILATEKNISLSSSEILTLMLDEFPKQFSSFISRSIDADLSQHISLLKRVENSGLSVLVESLLLNRPTYITDEEQGILHPYIYTLLNKYKQPLYSLSIDPKFKTKLIEYFKEHANLEYASDVVDLLRNK